MIWGQHAAQEAWKNPDRGITKAFATENAHKIFLKAVENNVATLPKRPKFEIVDNATFEKLTKLGRDTVHQGIALKVEDLPEIFLDELLAKIEHAPNACIVILDQVTDPHNIGAIMRSAAAFGADALIMQTRHAPASMNGTLAKIACGAVEHIPTIKETNLSRAIETCKERGITAYALDERGTATLGQNQLDARGLFVMGAEGKGVRPSLLDACDHIMKLDTQAPIYSLNVSNAAAITLFEHQRSNASQD